MNKLIKLFLLFVAVVSTSSCETYKKDFDIDYSPIFPMCGEWVIVSNTDQDTIVSQVGLVMRTYDTADKSSTEMWVWINTTNGFKGKVPVDVAAKTFGPASGKSTLAIGDEYYDFTVSDGKVTMNGYTTLTGGKADLLEFTYTTTAPAALGKTYKVVAFRQTGWGDDDPRPKKKDDH